MYKTLIKSLTKKVLSKLRLKYIPKALVSEDYQVKLPSDFFSKYTKNLNIIDLGSECYSGEMDASYKNLISHYSCNVYCFDIQDNKTLKILAPGSNFISIQEAVFDGTETNFYDCNPPAASGIYPPNKPVWDRIGLPLEIKKVKRIKTKKLDDLIPKNVSIDFIKLDIQGAEITALTNGADVLKNVSFVQAEGDFIELFEGGAPLFPEVFNFMKSKGFTFFSFGSLGLFSLAGVKRILGNGSPEFYHNHFWSKQIGFSLGIFYRGPEYFKNDPAKILNSAAIAHASYNAYDLARLILTDGVKYIPNGKKILDEYESLLRKNNLI
ncbi:protein of unknown function [Candidatus Methylopumilus planktonicus]|uniref:Methyltransferase FkbM domain-containing protein n=1 Tax=Candidatus Methylopumilus planktonicus TaxID=1581557 RepID=A0A0D6EX42_9PROT|nr:FkbM family methyltransferase [Candidatus Methylopumilus planktonicus]CEZ19813.1 protein of unknown function [Candidatus Methylopumilus planktonicus]